MIRKLLAAIVLSLSITNLALAQTKDETAVAAAVEKLRKAMVDGNRVDLESIVMEKLSYGHSGGHIDDKKEFVEKLAGGSSDFVSIDLADQTINVSGNVAIVRHKLNAKTNDGGKPGEVRLLILLIFQKDHKQWKLLARQAVKIAS
ncbi:MAG TPA: nuclear transport factor 2 family protein [Chitinophagaceae bacterium]|nr:nuclear transport factor 2 family protein [Chitinophagaceae bacterium]